MNATSGWEGTGRAGGGQAEADVREATNGRPVQELAEAGEKSRKGLPATMGIAPGPVGACTSLEAVEAGPVASGETREAWGAYSAVGAPVEASRDLESRRVNTSPQSTLQGKGKGIPDATSDGCRAGAEEIVGKNVGDVCPRPEAAAARFAEEAATAEKSRAEVADRSGSQKTDCGRLPLCRSPGLSAVGVRRLGRDADAASSAPCAADVRRLRGNATDSFITAWQSGPV